MTKLTKLRREVSSHILAHPLIIQIQTRMNGEGAIMTMWEKGCRKRYRVSLVELFQRMVWEEVRRNKK